MELALTGLQAAIMDGSEPTFDGQPMLPGVHFRWSFVPELGFPPGGFWLCRKLSSLRGECLETPEQLLWDTTAIDVCLPPNTPGPAWGLPDWEGWQIYSAPYVLPLTAATWPTRYTNAPAPNAPDVLARDVLEAMRRLGPLKLAVDRDNQTIDRDLRDLRSALAGLVRNYPNVPLGGVAIADAPPADAAFTPAFGLTAMQQLLMLAQNPMLARVLGLYTVLPPGAGQYDYGLIGLWGPATCAARTVAPGAASASDLADGLATTGGLTVTASASARLLGWTKQTATLGLFLDLLTPPTTFTNVIAGTPGAPTALLAATSSQGGTVEVCRIRLAQAAGEVVVQLAGRTRIAALSDGATLVTQDVRSQTLVSVTLRSPSPEGRPIDTLVITADGATAVVGHVTVRPVVGPIGTRAAMFPHCAKAKPLPAPARPTARLLERRAGVVDSPPPARLAVACATEVAWPAAARHTTKNPQVGLPPANTPAGFVVDRMLAGQPIRLPQLVAPVASERPSGRVYACVDRQPDPAAALTYQVAGYDVFGALGAASPASEPLVIDRSVAAPILRLIDFDNTPTSGGQPDPAGWRGGKLRVALRVPGDAWIHTPDIRSVRVWVEALEPGRTPLATRDVVLPAPALRTAKVSELAYDPVQGVMTVATEPPPPPGAADLPGMLILHGRSLADGRLLPEVYAVVAVPDPRGPNRPCVFRLSISPQSPAPLRTARDAFLGRPAYLVPGFGVDLELPLPTLLVDIPRTKLRCRVYAHSSAAAPPQLPAVDPDAPGFASAAKASFQAPQRLPPPTPSTPPRPPPSHIVRHDFFDPPDYYGQSRRALPFDVKSPPGGGGFLLLRAPASALFLTDAARRLAANALTDANPVVREADTPRADLATWIAALPAWLAAYKLRRQTSRTAADVLADADGQRAFLEHFHDGLLDDELRALADVPANLAAFARVNGDPRAITGTSLRDSVDGPGHGRFLYKLQAVNAAGLASGVTLALGPYYTRRVTPPPAPVLLKTQPQPRLPALILAWALVDDPEIAGYLVYRADDPRDLADLRFSGAAVGEVGPAALAALTWQPTRNPALAFDGPGAIDPRILAVVPDPRLFARDREGSNMAEVVLPTGVAPTEILAVHRASEYRDTSPPHDQPQAFNYFTAPNRGGIATLVPGPPARITGLRVGLGRGATVVVVARVASVVQVYGVLPAPRATYVDGAAGVLPLDRSTLAGRAPTNGQSAAAYALVAVDRFGNRSAAAPPSLVPPFYSPP